MSCLKQIKKLTKPNVEIIAGYNTCDDCWQIEYHYEKRIETKTYKEIEDYINTLVVLEHIHKEKLR